MIDNVAATVVWVFLPVLGIFSLPSSKKKESNVELNANDAQYLCLLLKRDLFLNDLLQWKV